MRLVQFRHGVLLTTLLFAYAEKRSRPAHTGRKFRRRAEDISCADAERPGN
jgi:hypothetical protein